MTDKEIYDILQKQPWHIIDKGDEHFVIYLKTDDKRYLVYEQNLYSNRKVYYDIHYMNARWIGNKDLYFVYYQVMNKRWYKNRYFDSALMETLL